MDIPKGICNTQRINKGDMFEFLLYNGMICLKKFVDENDAVSVITRLIKIIDTEEENMTFSLTPFCGKVYRLSEMTGDNIAASIISDRI